MLFLTLRIVEGGPGEALDQTEQKYPLANFPNRQREITPFSMAVLFYASISGCKYSIKGSGGY